MDSAGKITTRPPDYLRVELKKSNKKDRNMLTTATCTASTSSATTSTISSMIVPTPMTMSVTTSDRSSVPARSTDDQFALIQDTGSFRTMFTAMAKCGHQSHKK